MGLFPHFRGLLCLYDALIILVTMSVITSAISFKTDGLILSGPDALCSLSFILETFQNAFFCNIDAFHLRSVTQFIRRVDGSAVVLLSGSSEGVLKSRALLHWSCNYRGFLGEKTD